MPSFAKMYSCSRDGWQNACVVQKHMIQATLQIMEYLLAADAFRGLEARACGSENLLTLPCGSRGRSRGNARPRARSHSTMALQVAHIWLCPGPIKVIGYELLHSPGAADNTQKHSKAQKP